MSRAYYIIRAAQALHSVGAPDADPTEIAEWAAAHHDDERLGVIVDQDGHIWAETELDGPKGQVQARYVIRVADGIDPQHVLNREIGLAKGFIGQQIGRPVVHFKHSEVARGHVFEEVKLTVPQVAARFLIEPATFRSYVSRGQAPAADGMVDGGRPYWLQSTIDRWRTTKPASKGE